MQISERESSRDIHSGHIFESKNGSGNQDRSLSIRAYTHEKIMVAAPCVPRGLFVERLSIVTFGSLVVFYSFRFFPFSLYTSYMFSLLLKVFSFPNQM